MLKNILNLDNVEALSKEQQKNIHGGGFGKATCKNGAGIESNTSVTYAQWQTTVSNYCGHQGGVASSWFFGNHE